MAAKRPHRVKGSDLRKILKKNPGIQQTLRKAKLRIDEKSGLVVSVFGVLCFAFTRGCDRKPPPFGRQCPLLDSKKAK